jgi:serine/threonine protein kinase
MAFTYRCVLEGPGGFRKLVLVKVLQPNQKDSAAHRQMFLDEARLCGRLNHPHIPQVFELGEHNGLPFMVMEYVAGPNLVMVARKLRHGEAVPYGMLAHMFAGVARALHHAHTLSERDGRKLHIVHRDVSLANILVSPEGHAKLIDFGIAKWELGEAKTEVGSLKGKLRYMAPEQFQEDHVDHRADLYQLGVSMYWLATGKPPFSAGGLIQQIAARLEKKPPSPTEVVPGFPEKFAGIILRCLERSPEARHETAELLARELEEFIDSDPAWHADEASVGRWVRNLFPEEELAIFTSTTRTHATSSGTVDLHPDTLGPPTDVIAAIPPIPESIPQRIDLQHTQTHDIRQHPITARGLAGLILVAVLSAATTVVLTPSLREAILHRSENNPAANATTLMDRAESLLLQGEVSLAKNLAMEVRSRPDLPPDVLERAVRLTTAVDISLAISKGRRALGEKRYAEANELATQVLELDERNADALNLLETTRRAEAAALTEPTDPEPPARAVRPVPTVPNLAPTPTTRAVGFAPVRPDKVFATSPSPDKPSTPDHPTDGGSEEHTVRPDPTRNPRTPAVIKLPAPSE